MNEYFFSKKYLQPTNSISKQEALKQAICWLENAQNNDKGFGSYFLDRGLSSSYPETSGYIIPTLFKYYKIHSPEKLPFLIDVADWLVKIQKPSGGWQSGYVEDNKKEVVFNTGQVIRGLIEMYSYTKNENYLNSCIKACNWLVQTQEANGSWIKTAYMQKERVYDSYVVHPMLLVYEITKDEKIKNAAVNNLNWIIETQQHENGWFANCDNTIKHNHAPILHTISYTIDGLIASGEILKEEKYIQSGKIAADKLLDLFCQKGFLNGRWDSNWNGSEYIINTGCAQISIIWSQLYRITKDEKYIDGVRKINQQLVYLQQLNRIGNKFIDGGLTGSFPIWGKYEPYGFPNWATKYFSDALLLELYE